MNWFERIVLRHQKVWLLLIGLFLALAAWQALHLPIVTSTDAIIPRDEAWRYYQEFRQEFGADDALVIALSAPDILAPEVIDYVRLLTSSFEEFPEVEDVLSLSNVEDIFGSEEDFVVEPLIGDRDLRDPQARRWVESRLQKNPLIYGNLVSRDLKATILLLRTAYRGEDLDFENRLVKRVSRFLEGHPPPKGVSLHLSGWPLVNVKMAAFMNQDLLIFVPVSFVTLCLLVYLFLRSFRATLAVALILNLSLLSAMAALKMVGGALSPMTAILAPLTMALSLADVIHVVTTYFRLPEGPRRVIKTVSETWSPCFLTSLTTSIGFASLLLSRIPSIREFGAAAAAAMFIEYFFTFTVLVFLLPWIGRGKWAEGPLRRLIDPLAKSYPAWWKAAFFFFLLATIGSLYGVHFLKVESDVIEYFHHSTKVYQDARFIDQKLGGVHTIELSLKAKEGDFLDPIRLKKIEALSEFLRQDPVFSEVISPADFFKLMNRAFHAEDERFYRLPETRALISQYMLLYGGTELEHFLSQGETWARISARTPVHNSAILNQKIRLIEAKMAELFPEEAVEARVTGKTYLVNRTVDDIVNCQVESLALAAFLIFGLMFLVLRSFKLGLLSVAPNVFPLLANLGFMGFFGIPLNTATATISAVAIGIAVDDTIHFLVRYQRARKAFPPVEAVRQTLKSKGLAAITTSLVLIIGFLVLTTSRFIPTVQFGFLCALVMLLALLADLFLLPALIKLWERRL